MSIKSIEIPISPRTTETVRFYTDECISYPLISVTSALGIVVADGLKQWFKDTDGYKIRDISEKSAQQGEEIHAMLEAVNLGKKVDIDPRYQRIINAYENFTRSFKSFKVLETEYPVLCPKYGFAGRVDAIVEVDGKVEIWDYKSGKSVSITGGWQMGGYKIGIEEEGKYKIDGMRVIHVNPNKALKDFSYTHFEFCEKTFLKCLDIFHALYFNYLAYGIKVNNKEYKIPVDILTQDSIMVYMKGKEVNI